MTVKDIFSIRRPLKLKPILSGLSEADLLELIPDLARLLRRAGTEYWWMKKHVFEAFEANGLHVTQDHFYSPLPTVSSLADGLWEGPRYLNPAFAFDMERMGELFDELASFASELADVPRTGTCGFYWDNNFFPNFDALIYYGLCRQFRPAIVLEVGSGFSTHIALRAAQRNGVTQVRCIEPYPTPALQAIEHSLSQLHVQRVQDVPMDVYRDLRAGDIFFVDTSHVSKIGGDLHHLLFHVLPALPAGVLVHFHDIFLPREYPREWVIGRNWFWNEQYLLLAFLMYNEVFRVFFMNNHFLDTCRQVAERALGGLGLGPLQGSSVWLHKEPPAKAVTPTIPQGPILPAVKPSATLPIAAASPGISVQAGKAMDPERIEGAKAEIIAKYGDWTAHNIHLGHGLYTRGARVFGDEVKVGRAVQLITDLLQRPWNQLRILDLGCHEGLYAIEFAQRGASVVAIDGREANLARADFARGALGLANVTFIQSDVRELSLAKHGTFDVVLCWGLLYHLDTPAVFEFAERMRQVCRGLTIVDTHISLSSHESRAYEKTSFWVDPDLLGPLESRSYRGKTYWGRSVFEHAPQSSQDERRKNSWASLDNPQSFWLTRSSLVNALSDAGFTTVFEVHAPLGRYPPDRVTMVALPSAEQDVVVAPQLHAGDPVYLREAKLETGAVHRETGHDAKASGRS